ncbi:hypothetical protein [Nostoc sp. ATCC 53789]|uniref:hypothetical protein n=1 Tax=Nostoc sp. ATCC 53789 TaxID=76335 RepID=UPI000DEC310F|nr:hypothetical protein [Nostoc sp. ATCC 53789]QHG18534.1 hypothetical protein GJB62_22855 [Nostoc sp. ATCC 53789]RCJ30378.1 hypothetical protein A6V25_14840 [Nostoc sp. ATCC 53789]
MNLRIRRRRFGQLAIVSAVTAASAKFTSKVFAQQSEQLYGVSLSSASKSKTQDLVDTAAANAIPGIIFQSINFTTGQVLLTAEIAADSVTNSLETTESVAKALVVKKPSERITAFTVLPDNTFVIAAVAATKKGDFSRLISITPPKKSGIKPPKGLKIKKNKDKKYSTVEGLLSTTIKGKQVLLGVISLAEGSPPFELAFIDQNSGQVDSSVATGLPYISPKQRLSNLAQSPLDGKIYATSVGGEGSGLSLVQLDLENRAVVSGRGKIIRLVELSFKNKPLENDLASLAFSSSGQLFALADPKYEGTNSLFTVDMKTGAMTLVRKFAVDKILFVRA